MSKVEPAALLFGFGQPHFFGQLHVSGRSQVVLSFLLHPHSAASSFLLLQLFKTKRDVFIVDDRVTRVVHVGKRKSRHVVVGDLQGFPLVRDRAQVTRVVVRSNYLFDLVLIIFEHLHHGFLGIFFLHLVQFLEVMGPDWNVEEDRVLAIFVFLHGISREFDDFFVIFFLVFETEINRVETHEAFVIFSVHVASSFEEFFLGSFFEKFRIFGKYLPKVVIELASFRGLIVIREIVVS